MTSSFEKPKTNASLLSIRVTSIPAPNVSDRRVLSSRPPKPAPRMTTCGFFVVFIDGLAEEKGFGGGLSCQAAQDLPTRTRQDAAGEWPLPQPAATAGDQLRSVAVSSANIPLKNL